MVKQKPRYSRCHSSQCLKSREKTKRYLRSEVGEGWFVSLCFVFLEEKRENTKNESNGDREPNRHRKEAGSYAPTQPWHARAPAPARAKGQEKYPREGQGRSGQSGTQAAPTGSANKRPVRGQQVQLGCFLERGHTRRPL